MFKKMKFAPKTRDEMIHAQNALFKLGYRWVQHGQNVAWSNENFLYTTEAGEITYGSTRGYFDLRAGLEMTLVTTVTHTLEEVIKPETVELNGKTYLKADLEAALEKLKPVEE